MPHADSSTELRAALQALDAQNVKHPKAVADAIQQWNRICSTRPAQPAHHTLRDAVIAGASDAELGALVLADLGAGQIRAAWAAAEQHTARAALAAITEHRADYLTQLQPLAAELITLLEATAAITAPLDSLIRAGDHTSAKLVADLETTAAALDALYRIRDTWLLPPGWKTLTVNGFDASRVQNPHEINGTPAGSTLGESFLGVIRQGGTLHYSAPETCREIAQNLWDGYAAEQAEISKRNAALGSYVAW